MLIHMGVAVLGALIFLFIFWRKLKEDYSSDVIFKSSLMIFVGMAVGWGMAAKYEPRAFLWGLSGGCLVGLMVACRFQRIRFFESLEAVVISGLPWMSLFFLKDSAQNSSMGSFLAFLATLVAIFIYYYFNLHYKEFSWYRSGKVGFSGLFTLMLVFAVRLVVAVVGVPVVSFFKYDAIMDAVLLLVSTYALITLGKEKK